MAPRRWAATLLPLGAAVAQGGGGTFVPSLLASVAPPQRLRDGAAAGRAGLRGADGCSQCHLAPLLGGFAAAGVAAAAAALGRRGRTARCAEAGTRKRQAVVKQAVLDSKPTATFQTTLGDFRVEIFLEQMPVTASNFIDLVQRGFYDGIHFHRVVPGFVCQFGCPNAKDPHSPVAGRAGPRKNTEFSVLDGSRRRCVRLGGHIPDEFTEKLSNAKGTLSMANQGMPDTGGSQFFINLNDNSYLDWFDDRAEPKHPVFGKVIEGWDVVVKISNRETDGRGCPLEPVMVLDARLDL